MSSYLVKLKPLEPYFFGGERHFQYPEEKTSRKEYFIRSEDAPSQTTLLGMIRFLVLKRYNMLSEPNDNSNRNQQKKLIGKDNFKMMSSGEQSYGKINSIGSLFLIHEESDGGGEIVKEHYLIPCPFHHDGSSTYSTYKKESAEIKMAGTNIDWFAGGYNCKDGVSYGYVDLNKNLEYIPMQKIYKEFEKVGIYQREKRAWSNMNARKNLDDGYFKRVYKKMEKEFSFAFFVDCEEGSLPESETVFMGQKKSAFQVSVVERKEDLLDKVKTCFQKNDNVVCYYALSHVKFKENPEPYCTYHISENRNFQYLTTRLCDGNVNKSNVYSMVKPGSVFFVSDEGHFESCYDDQNLKKVGFNNLVRIGE